MEDIAQNPHARSEDIEEVRERLAGLIGTVKMVPTENRQLVAEIGLHGLVLPLPAARGRSGGSV